MASPDAHLVAAFEATWPAAETRRCGGFLVGRGLGAGGRVSSAISIGPWCEADLSAAEAQHAAWDQPVLFRAWDDQTDLIATLGVRGYHAHTPTLIMTASVPALTDRPMPPLKSFAIWPPLAIQKHIWAAGNIDAARQAVMNRTALPKAALLGRSNDRAAGAGFVAVHGKVAMVHAVEVLPAFRRQGLGGWMMRQAAFWAQDLGATTVALAVSRANTVAQATYASLGFTAVGSYSYYERSIADG